MVRLGTLLCLLALVTAQVPLIACVSDFHAVVVAGFVEHACHNGHACEAGAHHDGHLGCRDTGCGLGQDHDGGPASGHAVIQVPLVVTGTAVGLPAPGANALALLDDEGAPERDLLGAVRLLARATSAQVEPGARLASVRLLL